MKKANYKDQESKEHTSALSNDHSFPRHISNTFVCFLPLEQCVQALMITALRWAKNQIGFARSKSSHNLKQKLSTRLNWFCQSLGSVKRPWLQAAPDWIVFVSCQGLLVRAWLLDTKTDPSPAAVTWPALQTQETLPCNLLKSISSCSPGAWSPKQAPHHHWKLMAEVFLVHSRLTLSIPLTFHCVLATFSFFLHSLIDTV